MHPISPNSVGLHQSGCSAGTDGPAGGGSHRLEAGSCPMEQVRVWDRRGVVSASMVLPLFIIMCADSGILVLSDIPKDARSLARTQSS